MSEQRSNFKQLVDEIYHHGNRLEIPNSPERTGTSAPEKVRSLTSGENEKLNKFLYLLSISERILNPVLPTCFVDGVYKSSDIFLEVWSEWDAEEELEKLYVKTLELKEVLTSLEKTIRTLELQISQNQPSNKTQIDEDSEGKKQQAIEFIKKRISITTRSKISGWGAHARKVKAIEFLDSYLDKYGRHPTNNELLKFKTMKHPELETGVLNLIDYLSSNTAQISASTLCAGGVYHSKDEQYVYDSLEKLCAESEKLASPALIRYPIEGVYKQENMIFECSIIEIETDTKELTESKFTVRRISHNEFENLRNQWSIENNEIDTLQKSYQASIEVTLLETIQTYEKLKIQD